MFKALEDFLKNIFNKVEKVELTTDEIKKLIEKEVNDRLDSNDISQLLNNNNKSIKELVSFEGNKIRTELNNSHEIKNIIKSEIQDMIDNSQNLDTKLKEYINETNETLRKELETKIKDGGNNMKDLIEEFYKNYIEANNKTIDIIVKEVTKHQELNDKLNNYLINNQEKYKENIENLNVTNEIEKNKLQHQIIDLNNKVEIYKEKKSLLDAYNDGVSHIRELLNSLEGDSLKELKDLIYENLKLVEDGSKKEEIENVLKVMSKSKPSIVKNLLYGHREAKEGTYRVINNEEIKFYNAINNYFGSEVVMVNRINDTNIETEYWQLVENKNGSIISEAYLPPMMIAGQIVKGVAKGGY